MYSNAIMYAVSNLRLILVVEAASIDDSALAIDVYSQGPLDCAFLKKKKNHSVLVHVGVGMILEGGCAHIRRTFNECRPVVSHWLESFPKPRTDGALQCRHAVAIVSCCLEFEPYGGVQLFVVLHNPLLYGFLLYGTFFGRRVTARGV